MTSIFAKRWGRFVAGTAIFVMTSVSMPAHAASTITTTTTQSGTVTFSASADGADRKLSLPCTDGTVRLCKSQCSDGTCSVIARWKDMTGTAGTAGLFVFPAKTNPTPESAAHQWCLAAVNSMGAPLGSGGNKKSTIRSVTKNGQASMNGFSCPTALESGVFEATP